MKLKNKNLFITGFAVLFLMYSPSYLPAQDEVNHYFKNFVSTADYIRSEIKSGSSADDIAKRLKSENNRKLILEIITSSTFEEYQSKAALQLNVAKRIDEEILQSEITNTLVFLIESKKIKTAGIILSFALNEYPQVVFLDANNLHAVFSGKEFNRLVNSGDLGHHVWMYFQAAREINDWTDYPDMEVIFESYAKWSMTLKSDPMKVKKSIEAIQAKIKP